MTHSWQTTHVTHPKSNIRVKRQKLSLEIIIILELHSKLILTKHSKDAQDLNKNASLFSALDVSLTNVQTIQGWQLHTQSILTRFLQYIFIKVTLKTLQ